MVRLGSCDWVEGSLFGRCWEKVQNLKLIRVFTKTMVLSMEVALCKNFSAYAYAIYAIVFRDKNSAVGVAENLGHRPDTRFNDSDFRLWSRFPQLCSEVFDSIAQTGKRGVKTPMFVCTRMVLIPIYLLILILCFALVYYYIILYIYIHIVCYYLLQ